MSGSSGGTSVATDSIRKALDHLPPSCIRIKAQALNDLRIIEARMKADQEALSSFSGLDPDYKPELSHASMLRARSGL